MVAPAKAAKVVQAHFYLDTPTPGQHQVDIEDAPAVWRLPDDTYEIKIHERTPFSIQFEIVGGEHDGRMFAINADMSVHNEVN